MFSERIMASVFETKKMNGIRRCFEIMQLNKRIESVQ